MTGDDDLTAAAAGVNSPAELGLLLRRLRRRAGRRRADSPPTYREIAAKTGWSVAAVGEYFAGSTLPPTDRLDVLIQLLGAVPDEQRALATARDRIEEARRQTAAVNDTAGPRPRQLPADVYGFTGRSEAIAALDRLLAEAGPGPAVVIPAVSGTAGVGKTALAVHWGHRVAARFPDGQLYADLRGYSTDPPAPPDEVLAGFLRALGVPGADIPPTTAQRAAAYRTLLAGRRILVLLDNARTANQVRPLLPGVPGCLALVTSRDDLSGLVARDGAHRIGLDVLTPVEAEQLLRVLLGDRVDADREASAAMIDRCARLPLALRVVAARAAATPELPLRSFVDDLAASPALDPFGDPDDTTDLRAVFSWSYGALGVRAAGLFRALGMQPAADLGVEAVASLAGLTLAEVRPALTELVRAHLVGTPQPGRYALHDLLRAYAAELAERDDPPPDRAAAIRRLLDYYLHTAFAAARQLDPNRNPIAVAPASPGVVVRPSAGGDEAMAWFAAEHQTLAALIRHAGSTGHDTHAWQLAWTLTDYFDRNGRWYDQIAVQRLALAATRRLGDRQGQSRTHNGLAHAYTKLGRYEEAGNQYENALRLTRELADPAGQARAHLNVGMVLDLQGRHREALRHLRRAYRLHGSCGNRAEEANALNAVGWTLARLGEYAAALDCCERALTLLRETGYCLGEAATLHSLGYIHGRLGEHGRAAACYRRALPILRAEADRYQEAEVLINLGEALAADGRPGLARTVWRGALTRLEDIRHPDAGRVRRLLGQQEPPAP